MVEAQRMRLEEEQDRLTRRSSDASSQLADKNPDSHELSPQRAEEELVAHSRSYRVRLLDIEDALRNLTAGDYGVCVGCLGDIEDDRLEARPASTFCARCAQIEAR